jgi:hypothetical protein
MPLRAPEDPQRVTSVIGTIKHRIQSHYPQDALRRQVNVAEKKPDGSLGLPLSQAQQAANTRRADDLYSGQVEDQMQWLPFGQARPKQPQFRLHVRLRGQGRK